MPAYLISRTNVEALDTVIFSAGPKEREEAVAVFTDPKSADAFMQDAGWAKDYTVATVEPIPFLRWLIQVHDEGVQHIVVDPSFSEQQAGKRLNTLSVKAHLEHAGKHIVDVARPDF
ncbi:MAG: hypothetical protein KDA87_12065 [Planctomycetales bacterium]|nr:hypothetical protein [Planctomycetales bacterium]